MRIIKSIQNRIYEIRDERVILDFNLASLYEVSTKVLNQAVKRNITRFPKDFMFRLTLGEWEDMRSQSVTAYDGNNTMQSQIVTHHRVKEIQKSHPMLSPKKVLLCSAES